MKKAALVTAMIFLVIPEAIALAACTVRQTEQPETLDQITQQLDSMIPELLPDPGRIFCCR